MPAPGLTYSQMKMLNLCPGALRSNAKLFGGAKKWDGRKITAKRAVKAGVSYEHLRFVVVRMASHDKDVARRWRLWRTDCAAHVLHLYENEHSTEHGPREAIKARRAFARGQIDLAAMKSAMASAMAAGGRTAGNARAAAICAADGVDFFAGREVEEKWRLGRLVAWLSDPEPKIWPLPRKQAA